MTNIVVENHKLKIKTTMLREALKQLLDDMGEKGHCVCEASKQQAIKALELYQDDSEEN